MSSNHISRKIKVEFDNDLISAVDFGFNQYWLSIKGYCDIMSSLLVRVLLRSQPFQGDYDCKIIWFANSLCRSKPPGSGAELVWMFLPRRKSETRQTPVLADRASWPEGQTLQRRAGVPNLYCVLAEAANKRSSDR